MKKIRVLIVDDSATMRRLIRFSLQNDPRIDVVGEAESALHARDLVKSLAPDVMTLDVAMPGMSGLEFLRRLMRARPMPVVMFSSMTAEGSEAAVTALSLGAVECVPKPNVSFGRNTLENLADTLCTAARANVNQPLKQIEPTSEVKAENQGWNGKIVLIGASTGGVEALEFLVKSLPKMCPPILITQHMPAQFLVNFAGRLDRLAAATVRLARDGDIPEPGEVLIAPGGETHLTLGNETTPKVRLLEGPKRTGHRPSVDEMMMSATRIADRIVGVILTGMGSDGAEGMAALRSKGARCLAQDQNSCVVFGMPRVAIEKGGVDAVLPLAKVPATILELCSRTKRPI